MKIYRILILTILALSVFSGCDEYLDENPSKTTSVVPETIEHLESLLNNYEKFASEPASEIIFGTDDFGLNKELYDAHNGAYALTDVQFATWDKEYLPNYDRPYWTEEWEKIFTANLILANLGNVTGDEVQKSNMKAEAHFVRVYSYFKLVDIYCLPYNDSNKQELGLPIKQTTSFEESLERANLEETWNFMKEDLEKALELDRPMGSYNGYNKIWRATTIAVKAFAARFYLAMNDYEKALYYAKEVLAEYNYLRDYNTEMMYSAFPYEVTIFNPDPVNVRLYYPYTHSSLQSDPTDKFDWGESFYYRYLLNYSWNYWPSEELLGLYQVNYDLRYKYHIVEDFSYDKGAVNPPYSYPGYIFFFKSEILSGPSVPEMILAKAECEVRLGQWNEGISTVNSLREKRMAADTPADILNLSATGKDDALLKVLEERRREMPFVTRWYDIRRFNNNETAIDDVVLTKKFYPYNGGTILGAEVPVTYTLEKNSRRYANPLPEADVITSNGALKQNQY